MSLIDSATLAQLRAVVTATLDTTVTIQRNVAGIWTTVVIVAATYVPYSKLPQENRSETDRLFIDDRWRVTFPASTDVRFGDRIVSGTRTFEVIQVPVSSLELYRQAIAQELTA